MSPFSFENSVNLFQEEEVCQLADRGGSSNIFHFHQLFSFLKEFFQRKHKFPVEKVWWSKMRYHLLNDLGLSPNLIFWQWAAAAKHKFLQCQLKLEHLTLRIIFYQGVILEIVINLFSSFWNVITDPRKECEVMLKWELQDKS